MEANEPGYFACPQCGSTFPVEIEACPHCNQTGKMIRLGSGRVKQLWETPGAEPAQEEDLQSIPSFGRYRDLEFIGKGGMGRVYKAVDPDLKRAVALKFIRGDDPDLGRRLMMEARLQASLEHENVCRVYEVGDVEGRLYIAMQYLRGRTLNTAAADMNLTQKVRVMRRVAEAVHEAHRVGLIHRDLKPANIMVELNEQGDWVPYVMDFGLARPQETGGSLTESGLIVGSPHYMSPEQARGEVRSLDRRTDVYGLGATMYELLCGFRLFDDDSSVQVMFRVLYHDPPPLRKRDPALPADLDTIVMKCLEKNPERRYPSARALAEDLTRYLDGDPIQARPASFFYRMSKKAAKNKALAAALAACVLVAFISGGALLQARRHARVQAELAQRFGIEVKEMESVLRNAEMMPLHDISRERKLVLVRMKDIEGQIGEVGSAGFGPCHYALGRGYLALRDYDRAKEHLQLAWDSGYREVAVAYALGQVLGILYDRQMELAKHLASGRDAQVARLQKEYRDPALQYLRMGSNSVTDPAAYVRGLVAFYDARYDEALKEAAAALHEVPWLYESLKLEGDVHSVRGTDFHEAGKYEQAAADFKAAGDAYTSAIDMARSDPSLYVSRCALGIMTMELNMARGAVSDQPFKDAVAACDSALVILPDNVEALEKKSWAYWRWGEYLGNNGQDPQQALLTAIEFGNRAVRINPDMIDAWMRLGASYNTLGEYQMQHGMDPQKMLHLAIDSSREMLRIDPNNPYGSNILGYAAVTLGEYEIANNLDPSASLAQAIEGFRKTTQGDPKFSKGFNNLAYTYLTRGVFETEHGRDARESLELAIRGFQDAIRVNPNYAGAYSNLGLTRVRLAQFEMQAGRTPLPLLEQARGDCKHSLDLNPQSAFTFNTLGLSYLTASTYRFEQHQDPAAEVELGITAFRAALQHKPDSETALANLVRIYVLQGNSLLGQGKSAAPSVRDARDTLTKLAAVNAEATPMLEASADLLEARSQPRAESAVRLLNHAANLLEDEKRADGLALLAEVLAEKARREKEHGASAAETIRQAIAAADAALKINPALTRARDIRNSLSHG